MITAFEYRRILVWLCRLGALGVLVGTVGMIRLPAPVAEVSPTLTAMTVNVLLLLAAAEILALLNKQNTIDRRTIAS